MYGALAAIGVVGALMYWVGGMRRNARIVLVGIFLIDLQFLIASAMLFHVRSYALASCFGLCGLYVPYAFIRALNKPQKKN
jgi:hypothetical protein